MSSELSIKAVYDSGFIYGNDAWRDSFSPEEEARKAIASGKCPPSENPEVEFYGWDAISFDVLGWELTPARSRAFFRGLRDGYNAQRTALVELMASEA
jgi:hypothetical protein